MSALGSWMDSNKIQIIRDWPAQKNVNEIHQFVGLEIFYKRLFHKLSSGITAPINQLTKKGNPLLFGLLKHRMLFPF